MKSLIIFHRRSKAALKASLVKSVLKKNKKKQRTKMILESISSDKCEQKAREQMLSQRHLESNLPLSDDEFCFCGVLLENSTLEKHVIK